MKPKAVRSQHESWVPLEQLVGVRFTLMQTRYIYGSTYLPAYIPRCAPVKLTMSIHRGGGLSANGPPLPSLDPKRTCANAHVTISRGVSHYGKYVERVVQLVSISRKGIPVQSKGHPTETAVISLLNGNDRGSSRAVRVGGRNGDGLTSPAIISLRIRPASRSQSKYCKQDATTPAPPKTATISQSEVLLPLRLWMVHPGRVTADRTKIMIAISAAKSSALVSAESATALRQYSSSKFEFFTVALSIGALKLIFGGWRGGG
jgi:hypothetical protein